MVVEAAGQDARRIANFTNGGGFKPLAGKERSRDLEYFLPAIADDTAAFFRFAVQMMKLR